MAKANVAAKNTAGKTGAGKVTRGAGGGAASKTDPKKTVVKKTVVKKAPVNEAEADRAAPAKVRASGGASAAAQAESRFDRLFDGAQAARDQRVISVRGAREHNLKNVDLTIPRDKLVVFTGLSGSGKSSLAFDTIYAEGQRRYVESLSAYARQFLEMMAKPDVDQIDGSRRPSPSSRRPRRRTRARRSAPSRRSTTTCACSGRGSASPTPATGLPIESQTVSQMVDRVLALPEKTRLYLLAPVVRGRKGEYRKEIAEYQKKGFQRLRIDGEYYAIDDVPKLDKKLKHDIDVVVDRIVVRDDIGSRLAESFETALELADGIADIEFADAPEGESPRKITFSSRFACPVSGFTIPEIEPRLFSFNNPFGACPTCGGIGHEMRIDPELVIGDGSLSLKRGAVAPWAKSTSPYYGQTLDALAKHFGFKTTVAWDALPASARAVVLYGTGEQAVRFAYDDGMRAYGVSKPFEGVIPNLERRYKETDSDATREEIGRFMSETPCAACAGKRLKPEALAVKIDMRDVAEVTALSVSDAHRWFSELPEKLTAKQNEIAVRILKEIRDRLTFLVDVGLEYLTLARGSGSLSGGESQRIRLASQIGSGLTGVLYVLDEPSIGLHQRDNERLLGTLKRLRDLGNSVIVVEHDEDAILQADYVVDVGPGAGIHGGRIIAQGTPEAVLANPDSLTAKYLTGALSVRTPTSRRKGRKGKLALYGARGNNLRDVDVEIPLGTFTCITGVSGGGKSTLIIDTLYKAVAKKLNGALEHPAPYGRLEGLEHLDKVIDIDQSPIGRTPRSNPATYIGAFTPIRDWFAGLPEAKARGYQAGRFSFNVKGGRCEACSGDGVIKIEMHFLPDVYVTCDVCKGRRYDRETLEVKYRERSISDVLDMTVEEAAELFKAVPAIRDKMETLKRVGLHYVRVGQQATTLSGGEAQRVKLSKELSKRATGRTLYILDEPTTGLHFHDVAKLMEVLHELVDQGNTVVVIEHNLEVVKTADWVIDMGPEGGSGGGMVVAQGTPEQIARSTASHTGRFLREVLARRPLAARRDAAE